MRKILFCLLSGLSLDAWAATGDTIIVNAHQSYIINWYGYYDQWAVFPLAGTNYNRILMKYTLSDPQPSTQWDYTTSVFLKHATGELDSALQQYPVFTVNGMTADSVYFSMSPTYEYFFNAALPGTDSVVSDPLMITLYADSANPETATDSIVVYPAGYYNYIYDTAGVTVDSAFVPFDSLWTLNYHNIYTVTEVKELFELARVMTPYGGFLPANWEFDYWFDVTDYAPLLHDSVEFSVFYDGYSNGYAFSVTFIMVEGIPPRNTMSVRNLYPHAYYEYGVSGNPIENHLISKSYPLDSTETQAMLRVIPSGHSFGGALNCAEFCNKSFKVLVNGVQQFSKQIWRTDCGLNPLWNQAGTWLYDRSNWCPGSKTLNKDQELTPFITPGDSFTVELNMDPYTYSGGAGFPPGYYLSTHLFTYGPPNFQTDATVDEILKPNADENYARFNPVCNNPVVVIKNTGSDPLTSCTINFGIKGGVLQSYQWTGFLQFLETEVVYLDSMTWGSSSGQDDVFEVYLSDVNASVDQNPWNDTLRSQVSFTPVYPSVFRLDWKTNNAAFETGYQLLDDAGNILYSNGALSAQTVYSDTFNLASGCYKFLMTDSQKDGLSFSFNSDGTGYARFRTADGTNTLLHNFQADFGTSIEYNFTVGVSTGITEVKTDIQASVYPNPAGNHITVELNKPQSVVQLAIFDLQGKIVVINEYHALKRAEVDVSKLETGLYVLQIRTGEKVITRKIARQ